MITKTKIRSLNLAGKIQFGAMAALASFAVQSAHAAYDYWAGDPGITATTNWTDQANWTFAGQSSPQTYYNEVEFTGVGASANNNVSVNNVLDNTTGVAQMPIWELDYTPTNGNYTTLISPGLTMSLGAGRGFLAVGADQLNGGSPAPANAVETISITGAGGTLSMVGNLYVGQGSPMPGDTHNVTLNLSGLDNFIDYGPGGSDNNGILIASAGVTGNGADLTGNAPLNNGTLYLAKTNSITLGDDFQICNQTSSNSMPCAVYLGNDNYIQTGTGNLIVGGTGTTTVGAWMKFNPAFLGGSSPPTAYFGSTVSDGRIANFWICNANGGPPVSGYALCDFSGGNVTMEVNAMQLGQGGNPGANALGLLTLDNGSVNVNNATIGNQEVSSGGAGIGVVNLNTNATYVTNGTLLVNNTLTLGAVSGTPTLGTAGTINISGGALIANTITNGGGTAAINVTNGTLDVTGTAGATNAPLSSLSAVNAGISVAVSRTTPSIVVTGLATGGSTNIINISAVPSSPSYPIQATLIKYSGAIGGAGYDFGLGTLPTLCAGFLSNNTANASIDLVLTTGPSSETWSGSVNGNWDTTTANWLVGSTHTTYANGVFVQFFDGASVSTVNLTTSLTPGGVTVSNNMQNYTINGSGAISGSTSLLKQGAGTLVLDNSGLNNFSGGVTIGAGALQVGNNDANGSLPAGGITDNGSLVFDQTETVTINNSVSGTGSLTDEGPGATLQLSGANTFSGPVLVTNSATLQLGGSAAVGLGTSNVIVASGSTLDADGYTCTKPIIVSGVGVDGNGALADSGGPLYDNPGPGFAASITLAGDTTFNLANRWDLGSVNGGTTLSTGGNAYNLTLNASGYFEWRNLSVDPALANINLPTGSLGVVGSTTFGNPNDTLTLGGDSALVFYGGPYSVVNKGVDFQDGAYIDCYGGNNIMSGAMTLEPGYCTFNISGGTSLTVSNVLSGSGVFYLTGGTGTVVIGGNSPSFTGGVYLDTGLLTLNGSIGSGITAVSGTTLAGSGTANGLADVSGAFLPGGAAQAGTFTASSLTLESPATLTMDLSSTTAIGGGTNDLIVVNGNLTVNGNNITINPLNGTLASGTYRLFNYSGTLSGSFGTASTGSSSRYSFTIDTSTAHEVNLVVSGAPNLLVWNNGANNGLWDVQSSFNWSNLTTHAEDQFYDADIVVLDDTVTNAAHPTTSITIGSGQAVLADVVTNNSTTNYTISGQGTISGGGSFVKMGSSTLTISTSNSFTGNFTIPGGAVQMNGQIQSGSSPVGASNGTLFITNGATLYVNLQGGYPAGASGFGAKPIVVSGAGANGLGAIQNIGNPLYNDSSTLGLGFNVTLAGNTTIGATSRLDWGFPGYGATLSTGGSNYDLTIMENQYFQWTDLTIDTNLGNIDIYDSSANGYTWAVTGMGGGLGNSTNILTLHSNVTMQIVHTENGVTGIDSGYAKVIHVVPTATYYNSVSGGAGDYRDNTSFILDGGSSFYYFNGTGGSGTGTVFNGPVTFNGLVHFEIGNSPLTFSNVISGPGGFYMDIYGGQPPLVFAAANTYQGITDLRANMNLSLIGNGSISQSTPISLASGATLAVTNRVDGTLTLASGQTLEGSGTVNGMLVAGAGSTILPGTTSAGSAIGSVGVSGNALLEGNTVFELDGASFDALTAGGNITYGGTLTVTNISATPLAAGNSFQLFSAAGYSGVFSSISPTTPGPGLAWNTNNLAVNGTLSVVTTSSPPLRVTGISVRGTTLTLTGTNGADNGTYVLLESTNAALPLGQWMPVLTNTFNSNGSLNLSTNIVNSNNLQEFYILETQ